MSAPERIWAWGGSYPDHKDDDWFNASATSDADRGGSEYIRADLVEAAVKRALEAAAVKCDSRGRDEKLNFGLGRATQNYYRARDAIRAMAADPATLDKLARGE
jgi:hypothetical protein